MYEPVTGQHDGACLLLCQALVHAEHGRKVDTHFSDSLKSRSGLSPSSSPSDPSSAESIALFAQFVDGDARAADALFQRYSERLIALARARLSAKMSARVSPDDIVMSAYRSFFVGAREGRYELSQPGALWRLLAQITLHKLYRQVAHHQAERRSINRETSGAASEVLRILSAEPSPEAAAELADELERWLANLTDSQQQMIQLRLQGEEVAEIARILGCSIKTVRRQLDAAKRILLGIKAEPESLDQKKSTKKRTRPRIRSTREPPPVIPGVTSLRFDDYKLEQQIGVGMTGKVYRARRHQSGENVAIKYLKKEFLSDPLIANRFLSEARIVAGLVHDRIVRLHGLGKTPAGGYFIAMDLAANGDLNQFLRNHRPGYPEIVQWLSQAAEALQFAHEHGVIHSDLKPSNLLVDANRNLIISDFGFAKQLVPRLRADHELAGTPAFMAPEQIDPSYGPISPATDIYGLGAVIFFLLFGRPPVTTVTSSSLRNRSLAIRLIDFPEAPVEVTWSPLIPICQGCLAKDPAQRIASMEELRARLRKK